MRNKSINALNAAREYGKAPSEEIVWSESKSVIKIAIRRANRGGFTGALQVICDRVRNFHVITSIPNISRSAFSNFTIKMQPALPTSTQGEEGTLHGYGVFPLIAYRLGTSGQ